MVELPKETLKLRIDSGSIIQSSHLLWATSELLRVKVNYLAKLSTIALGFCWKVYLIRCM